MKKSKKYTDTFNKQIIVFTIGVICIIFTLPAILTGNYAELIKIHPGRLRNIPLLGFLIVGLTLIIFSGINIFRKIRNKRKGSSQ